MHVCMYVSLRLRTLRGCTWLGCVRLRRVVLSCVHSCVLSCVLGCARLRAYLRAQVCSVALGCAPLACGVCAYGAYECVHVEYVHVLSWHREYVHCARGEDLSTAPTPHARRPCLVQRRKPNPHHNHNLTLTQAMSCAAMSIMVAPER